MSHASMYPTVSIWELLRGPGGWPGCPALRLDCCAARNRHARYSPAAGWAAAGRAANGPIVATPIAILARCGGWLPPRRPDWGSAAEAEGTDGAWGGRQPLRGGWGRKIRRSSILPTEALQLAIGRASRPHWVALVHTPLPLVAQNVHPLLPTHPAWYTTTVGWLLL